MLAMLRWITQQKGGKMVENLESLTKKDLIQKLLDCRKAAADYVLWKADMENARIEAEKARPNRFAITVRIARNDGTVDVTQNIIPRMEDNESMTIAIHPAAVVNG